MPLNAVSNEVRSVALRASEATAGLRLLSAAQRNACVQAYGSSLPGAAEAIQRAAEDDAAHARAHGLAPRVLQALVVDRATLEGKARLAATLAALPDPLGQVESTWIRPNGLKIERLRVPIGVVAILAEYDVGAVIDAVLLGLKAGDAVIVHAGPIMFRTCQAVMRALAAVPLPPALRVAPVQFVPHHGSHARQELLNQRGRVDVAIPVGSAAWVHEAEAVARVPVLGQLCSRRHTYVDEDADMAMAVAVLRDLLGGGEAGDDSSEEIFLHRAIAATLLPSLHALIQGQHLPAELDPEAVRQLSELRLSRLAEATPDRARVLVRVVGQVDDAIGLIAAQGPGLSAVILTNDRGTAARFASQVDAAAVYLNASGRFTSGSQFGMGAHVAVNTTRVHARGPLGIAELTTCKYLVTGKGQVLG